MLAITGLRQAPDPDYGELMAYDLPITAHWRKTSLWLISCGLNVAAAVLVARGKLGHHTMGNACNVEQLDCNMPGERHVE